MACACAIAACGGATSAPPGGDAAGASSSAGTSSHAGTSSGAGTSSSAGSSSAGTSSTGGGAGGTGVVLDPLGGAGAAGVPQLDGCKCDGEGFGVTVELGQDSQRLEYNRADEARCGPDMPAHAVLANNCGGQALSLWLAGDKAGAPPTLTVLGSSLTFVDSAGVVWTGTMPATVGTQPSSAAVLEGATELNVENPSGETRKLRLLFKLCTQVLPRALIIC